MALVLLPTPARAGDTAAAKRYNASATRHFDLGEFQAAIADYKAAYAARALPVFLYNLSQCYLRLGGQRHVERAIFYFESYLNNARDAADRAAVQQELASARRKLAALSKVKKREKAAPGSATPLWRRWWFRSAAAAATTLGFGLGVGLAARSDYQMASKLGQQGSDRARWSDVTAAGERKARAANILLVTGGALALTSAILYFVERGSARPAGEQRGLALQPTIREKAGGLCLAGSF